MKPHHLSITACLALATVTTGAPVLAQDGDAPPERPAQSIARVYGDTVGAVLWRAAEDDRGVVAYEVTKDGTVVQRGPRRSYLDLALSPGKAHRIGVTAIDTAGQRSEPLFVELETSGEGGGAFARAASGTTTAESAGGDDGSSATSALRQVRGSAPDSEAAPTGDGAVASAGSSSRPAACGEDGEAFRRRTVQLINEFRSQPRSCGTRGSFPATVPLSWDDQLYGAALTYSTDMASSGGRVWGHVGSDGSSAGDRIAATGYLFRAYAENISRGGYRYRDGVLTPTNASVKSAVDGWIESDGHCANLMNPNVTEVALACVYGPHSNGNGDVTHWTNVLAAPAER